jgi:hypothetical protein
VEIKGSRAIVRFIGSDASRITMQFERNGCYW